MNTNDDFNKIVLNVIEEKRITQESQELRYSNNLNNYLKKYTINNIAYLKKALFKEAKKGNRILILKEQISMFKKTFWRGNIIWDFETRYDLYLQIKRLLIDINQKLPLFIQNVEVNISNGRLFIEILENNSESSTESSSGDSSSSHSSSSDSSSSDSSSSDSSSS
ncbi:MAG: hypothetical protein WD512_11020, partial [Candidatus Paceibacterota bacterium]